MLPDSQPYSGQIKSWSDFANSIQQQFLPSVVWVMPVGVGAYDVSQHPAYNVTQGEVWLLNMVNSIMRSSYWNSTAIFIMYDGGGYHDQVPPPVVDGVQLWFICPFIVISHYVKENYVSHTMNHASLLAFVDYNWRLPALNQFVAHSSPPLDLLCSSSSNSSLNSSPRPPVELTATSIFPLTPQIPFNQLGYER
ncbi:MAG: hypothetical protein JRN20_18715 [Nitrososphaerota archaeon]|nr:hypothetical protein [Nitrososphaerota archaeon]